MHYPFGAELCILIIMKKIIVAFFVALVFCGCDPNSDGSKFSSGDGPYPGHREVNTMDTRTPR